MKGKVICELLNVRKAPEKGDNVITTIEKGTEMLILDDAGNWLKVNAGDVEGYVMAEYVELEQAEIDENGNFIVDGKVIGHVDGDDIVITDEEVIKETLKDEEPPKQEAEDQQNTGNTGGPAEHGNTGGPAEHGNTGNAGNTGNTGGPAEHGNTGGPAEHGNTGGVKNTRGAGENKEKGGKKG